MLITLPRYRQLVPVSGVIRCLPLPSHRPSMLAMINMKRPNEDQLRLMTEGMEIFVGVLGNVVAGIGQERH